MQTQNLVLSIRLWSLPIVPKWTTFLLYCTFYILQGKQHDWVTTERIPQCDSAALLLSSAVNIKEGKSRPYDNLSLDALGQKGTAKCVHACFSNIQYRVRELVLLEVEWLARFYLEPQYLSRTVISLTTHTELTRTEIIPLFHNIITMQV